MPVPLFHLVPAACGVGSWSRGGRLRIDGANIRKDLIKLENLRKTLIRLIVASLVVALFVAFIPMSASAAPADSSITVADSALKPYADNQQTFLLAGKPLDLRVTAKSGVTYYALKAGYVDVRYNGSTGIPVGSYFKPPFKNGVWVTTLAGNLETAPKTAISTQNNWTTQIPALTSGQIHELRIAAVRDGYDDVVFGHRFIGVADFAFSSNLVGSAIISTVSTVEQADGLLLVAIYKDDRLVHVESIDFSANLTDSKTFYPEFSKYPVSEYKYKAFCWGADYIPLAPTIDLT